MAQGTTKEAMDKVAEVLRSNNRVDPRNGKDGNKARAIPITFEDQRNGENMERNTQEAIGNPVLCPVRATAALVEKILKIPDVNNETPVCSFVNDVKVMHVTQDTLLKELKSAVTAIG
eukprot:6303034-Ditylum_brightwellii.AAC.1